MHSRWRWSVWTSRGSPSTPFAWEAPAKRLGWVLAYFGCKSSEVDRLAELPAKGYRTLDPTGPRKGSCNARWMVQENLPGLIGQ